LSRHAVFVSTSAHEYDKVSDADSALVESRHVTRAAPASSSFQKEQKGNQNMTPKLDLFAAAPALMKDYQRTSIALDAASRIEPKLSELVKLRAS
jgi:hypothetical protein